MKTVLVLMSTYNGEKYLREQLDSIYRQIDVNVSVLVRDDGSNDRTVEILEEYRQNKNLKYIKGENINWMHSFWLLVNMANGCDYYAFSDQDDIWDDDKLKKAVKKLEEFRKTPVVYCADQRIVDKNKKVLVHSEDKVDITNYTFLDLLVHGNVFRGCTEVWNDSLQQYILSKKISDINEPHDAFLMQLALAVGKVTKDNFEVMSYRQHENNAVGSKTGIELIINKIKKYFTEIFANAENKKIYSSRCKKIYDIVENDISEDKKFYYQKVCNYDRTALSAFRLAVDKDFHGISLKKRIQIMLRRM